MRTSAAPHLPAQATLFPFVANRSITSHRNCSLFHPGLPIFHFFSRVLCVRVSVCVVSSPRTMSIGRPLAGRRGTRRRPCRDYSFSPTCCGGTSGRLSWYGAMNRCVSSFISVCLFLFLCCAMGVFCRRGGLLRWPVSRVFTRCPYPRFCVGRMAVFPSALCRC